MDPAWPSIHILDFIDDNYDVYDDEDDDDSDDDSGALFLGHFLTEFSWGKGGAPASPLTNGK